MICTHCDGTGSLSKQLYGHQDCTNCDTADKRMELDEWCRANVPPFANKSTAAWLIYQHAKAEEQAKAEA